MNELLDTMAKLRHPEQGCTWNCEQTFDTIASCTIEEAYEVTDAIEKKDYTHLKEELGDLLFQVVFHSQIAKEKNLFDFNDVVVLINAKMKERHPHVFTNKDKEVSAQEQSKQWERDKYNRKKNLNPQQTSVLDDIPTNLPELLKAVKLTKRAAVIGFDWPTIEPVFEKMNEELAELKEAIEGGNSDRIKDELGDVVFVCANLARHLQIDPQLAIRHANKKFERRLRAVESIAKKQQPNQAQFELNFLESLWIEIKKLE